MTGKPLVFAVVHGDEARKDPLMPRADLDTDYIKVTLARPVPEHGQARVIIIKTYKDPKSYFARRKRHSHRLQPPPRHPPQQDRPAPRLRAHRLHRPLPNPHRARRPHRHRLHARRHRRGPPHPPRRQGRPNRPRRPPPPTLPRPLLGVPLPRHPRARPPRRASPPGPRHRLLPPAARNPLLRPLPRLHRVPPRHQQLRQRRPRRQQGLQPQRLHPRHRRTTPHQDS